MWEGCKLSTCRRTAGCVAVMGKGRLTRTSPRRTPPSSRNDFPAVRRRRRASPCPSWTRRRAAPTPLPRAQRAGRRGHVSPAAGEQEVQERCPSLLARVSALIERPPRKTHHPCLPFFFKKKKRKRERTVGWGIGRRLVLPDTSPSAPTSPVADRRVSVKGRQDWSLRGGLSLQPHFGVEL